MPPILIDETLKQSILSDIENFQLIDNIGTIPVHSNAGDESNPVFSGYSSSSCQIIQEINQYELANNTVVRREYTSLHEKVVPILESKF